MPLLLIEALGLAGMLTVVIAAWPLPLRRYVLVLAGTLAAAVGAVLVAAS